MLREGVCLGHSPPGPQGTRRRAETRGTAARLLPGVAARTPAWGQTDKLVGASSEDVSEQTDTLELQQWSHGLRLMTQMEIFHESPVFFSGVNQNHENEFLFLKSPAGSHT